MSKFEKIQSTIETLSASDVAKLREWIGELDARLFDERIAQDAASGKLEGLLADTRANLKAGLGEEF